MPEVWSYQPSGVLEEATTAAVRGVVWGPRAAVYTTTTSRMPQRFELQFGPCVNTAEVNSMLAFFRARNGGFEPFVWRNPIDTRTYTVRFDGSIRADLFAPGLFRSGANLAFLVTHTPTLTSVVGSYYDTAAGSGGALPDPSSGGGGGGGAGSGQVHGTAGAFWFPGAWYPAGYGWQGHDANYTALTPTANRLVLQPFFLTTTVFIDRVGLIVRSLGTSSQAVLMGVYNAVGAMATGYNAYPSALLVGTSLSLVQSLGLHFSATSALLVPGVYWLGYCTSGSAARLVTWAVLHSDVRVTGANSGGAAGLTSAGFLVQSRDFTAGLPSFAAGSCIAGWDSAAARIAYRVGSTGAF